MIISSCQLITVFVQLNLQADFKHHLLQYICSLQEYFFISYTKYSLGRKGLRKSFIPASLGVLSALYWLHSLQQVTMFSHISGPSLDLGYTWSSVKSDAQNFFPQYWQVYSSLIKTFSRQKGSSLYGTATL